MSNADSEIECAIGSYCNMECVATEWQNQEIYLLWFFTKTYIHTLYYNIIWINKICTLSRFFNEWVNNKCQYLNSCLCSGFLNINIILQVNFERIIVVYVMCKLCSARFKPLTCQINLWSYRTNKSRLVSQTYDS
jgi:hypothetical protein